MFDEVKILRVKEVLIRKDRECWNCNSKYVKGVKMVCETITINGEITNAYECEGCINKRNFKK